MDDKTTSAILSGNLHCIKSVSTGGLLGGLLENIYSKHQKNNDKSEEYIREAEKLFKKLDDEFKKMGDYIPKIAIFGDSGVGKSSLCNALFGKEIAKVSDVEACTRELQEIEISSKDGKRIKLIDVPGIGEDPQKHEEYTKLYKKLVDDIDLVIWAIKADDRKYATAIDVFEKELSLHLNIVPVVMVITQVDKIEPCREWDNKPSEKQNENIYKKIDDISKRFKIDKTKIIPISTCERSDYNLSLLFKTIIELLPNDKMYSFYREVKDEFKSPETKKIVEKSFWQKAKEVIQDVSGEIINKIITVVAPILIDKMFSILDKKNR